MEAVVKGRGRDRELLCSLALAACRIRVEKINCELNLLFFESTGVMEGRTETSL